MAGLITALAGGIGAAKFLRGLTPLLPSGRLAIIGNTGDDIQLHGLRICPDLDTVLYTLTCRVNSAAGWGQRGDTFHCLEMLSEVGEPSWFQLGDRDLAVHLFRTARLREGWTLTRVTAELARRFGLPNALLPMCEGFHPTMVETDEGLLHLQEYFVRERCRPPVRGFRYQDLGAARLEPEVTEVLNRTTAVIFCPSNPFISLGPILEVPGMRQCLRAPDLRVAVTPIIGGRAVKGPAAKMLAEMGRPVSALGVAECYRGLIDRFVLDASDADLAPAIEGLGMEVQLADTLMTDDEASRRLAGEVLERL